ncbi:MAG: hypothetical protein KAS05_02440 [Candidatus Omnitrophica bacterium]|nr:hypothetical protein [Candidatus Omnitrophota bacterium]
MSKLETGDNLGALDVFFDYTVKASQKLPGVGGFVEGVVEIRSQPKKR